MALVIAILALASLIITIWALARPEPTRYYLVPVAMILISIAVLLPVAASLR